MARLAALAAGLSDAEILVRDLQYASPIILLFFFLVAFSVRSVYIADDSKEIGGPASSSDPGHPPQLGPGGKALPARKLPRTDSSLAANLDFSRPRKLLFNWLSVFTALTFVANAANICLHAIVKRREGWWCGEATVVRCSSILLFGAAALLPHASD